MRTRIGIGLASALVLAVTAALAATQAGASKAAAADGARVSARATTENVPGFGHVFLVIGENTTYSHLTTTNAPYLMTSIRPRSAWLANYYAATRWSQANYVALVTGQFNRCEQRDGGIACHQNTDNLYHQLDVAGLSWQVWLEQERPNATRGLAAAAPATLPAR